MPVPDMSAVSALFGSLNTATEIVKSFVGLRDTAMIQGKVIELQTVILSAQSSAFAANATQTALLDQVRHLETQVASLKTWEAEKQRYQLQEMGRGAFAYVLKAEASGGQPLHALCQTCYERGAKSLLQSNGAPRWDEHYWACPVCKAQVRARSTALKGPDEQGQKA